MEYIVSKHRIEKIVLCLVLIKWKKKIKYILLDTDKVEYLLTNSFEFLTSLEICSTYDSLNKSLNYIDLTSFHYTPRIYVERTNYEGLSNIYLRQSPPTIT